GTVADQRSDRANRERLSVDDLAVASQESRAGSAGRRAVTAHCDECRRGIGREAGRPGRSDQKPPEQDADAPAPPYPPGAHAGTTRQVEQDARTVGARPRARPWRQSKSWRETPMTRQYSIALALALASGVAGNAGAQQITDAHIR